MCRGKVQARHVAAVSFDIYISSLLVAKALVNFNSFLKFVKGDN